MGCKNKELISKNGFEKNGLKLKKGDNLSPFFS
jgi:hypothetical protein